MLRWPNRAKLAIAKLFQPLQDIDIFVEDENDEVFYKKLFNVICGESIKVARVVSLGGRSNVIQNAMSFDHGNRRAIFIIDGDLEWVSGESAPSVRGLYRLNGYCIENFLFCENAIARVISEDAVIDEDTAKRKIDYKSWVDSISHPMLCLFASFVTVRHFTPSAPTVSQGAGTLCERSGKTKLDVTKVQNAVKASLSLAEQNSDRKSVGQFYKHTLSRLEKIPKPLHCISGKDYLMPLLQLHLSNLRYRIKNKQLRFRLASNANVNHFSDLLDALNKTARGAY